MRITVECERPKYAKGRFQFDSLDELCHWLNRIQAFKNKETGIILHSIAKDGDFKGSTVRYRITIECNFRSYELAVDLGFKTKLLVPHLGGYIYSEDRASARKFAREMDKHA